MKALYMNSTWLYSSTFTNLLYPGKASYTTGSYTNASDAATSSVMFSGKVFVF